MKQDKRCSGEVKVKNAIPKSGVFYGCSNFSCILTGILELPRLFQENLQEIDVRVGELSQCFL